MSGMIGSGIGYKQSALAGFQRVSEQEQQRETANRQADDAATRANVQTGVSAAMLIATIASMMA